MDNIAIKINNLTKQYKLYSQPIDRLKESLNPFGIKYHKDFYALKDINFKVNRGETVGIVGRNGSGKSTLLKIIAGVLSSTSGDVHVNGKISAILELGAGFNGELTGLENIYLSNTINGVTKNAIEEKVKSIVDFSELGDFIDQPIKTYSSGMKARLAFGVAINVEPDILIVDEALSVGDAAFQRKCFAKIEEIRKKGSTILFCSHSENSIVSLCSRAIWIHRGEYIIDGAPKFVTGLYMKHISSKIVDKSKINNELKNLEKRGNVKAFAKEKPQKVIKEFYNPNLKPKTTIYYKEKGARISDVCITTMDGQKVNVLISGRKYIYQYKINTFRSLRNVQYGFLFKTQNGIDLGGGAYPSKDKYVDVLDRDVVVKIDFICSLNNGVYFCNAGLMGQIGDKIDYIHRILDVYVFKVVEADLRVTSKINFIKDISVRII